MKIIKIKVEKFPQLTKVIRKDATFPRPVFRCWDCKEILQAPQIFCKECLQKVNNQQNLERIQQSL